MIIAVIPARGGSKGIKRKNLRLLNGKPLIQYVLERALFSKFIEHVIVTTDDKTIANFVKRFNVLIRNRPEELAADNITLDPVVIDAVEWYERKYNEIADVIVTIQPTSPLLSTETLDKAIEHFSNNEFDSLLSVTDDTHLSWKIEKDNLFPDYTKRLNRQWLPKKMKETGTFVISKRKLLNGGQRIGGKVGIYELPSEEAIDIDSPVDWLLSSALLNKTKIEFVVTGNSSVGTGHVYRALILADFWLGNDIKFILYNTSDKVEKIIKNKGYKIEKVSSLIEVKNFVPPDSIVVNDILDTTTEYIERLKSLGTYVVNFEDLGDGSYKADLVFNALYEKFNPPASHKYGYKYECLNENFLLTRPNDFREKVKTILVTFGGADPSNLTYRTLCSLKTISKELNIRVVIGPAYKWKDELLEYVRHSWKNRNIEIMGTVENMAEVMKNVDIALTSNGRTIYELASMGIPMISIAQNDRETMHLFARYSRGIEYIGIECNVTSKIIKDKINELIINPNKRKEMYEALPIKEIRKGLFNVTQIIEEKYRRWKNERNNYWK